MATPGAAWRVADVNLVGHAALVPPLPGLAGWHAMAKTYALADRFVWERRTFVGDEPQVRALTELLWRRPDFRSF